MALQRTVSEALGVVASRFDKGAELDMMNLGPEGSQLIFSMLNSVWPHEIPFSLGVLAF
jgi:hypothetical protein